MNKFIYSLDTSNGKEYFFTQRGAYNRAVELKFNNIPPLSLYEVWINERSVEVDQISGAKIEKHRIV